MKDFFEDLGKRLSETAEAVTAKAGDAIEIQKLKSTDQRACKRKCRRSDGTWSEYL